MYMDRGIAITFTILIAAIVIIMFTALPSR